MKLYIKQKVFSWRDRFFVKDEYGNDKYYIEGEIFSWGKKLHIYNMSQEEVAFIKQEVFSFMPRFYVLINDVEVAEIVKEFTFFFPKYRINGLGWHVDGDFFDHDYVITQNDETIVNISKEWFTWGDSYELDISPNANEVLALSVVLAIDCVIDAQRNNNH